MQTHENDLAKRSLLEAEILEEVRRTNPRHTVHFDYSNPEKVKVTTFNPLLSEMFILASVQVTTSVEKALQDVLNYVKTHREEYNSFTVIWAKKLKEAGDPKPAPSVFYCNSIRQVLDKFFDGKDEDMYIIYEIKMNPIA